MFKAAFVGLGFGLRWVALYGALSLVTQIWAGGPFSGGQGGGLRELIKWSVIFGVISVAVIIERALRTDHAVQRLRAATVAAVVGHMIGTVIAIIWFSTKGGPEEGDWWVGPASAATAVALWEHLLAPRLVVPQSPTQ